MANLTVTPAITFDSETSVDAATLNLAASPSVSVPPGGIGAADLDLSAVTAALEGVVQGTNMLGHGNFWAEHFLSAAAVLADGVAQENARDWEALVAGGAGSFELFEAAPDGKSSHAAMVKGGAGVTGGRLQTYVPRGVAGALLSGDFTISAQIYNGTGTDGLRPKLELHASASGSEGDASDVELVYTQSAASTITNSAWSRLQWTVDGSALPAIARGFSLRFRIPDGSWLNSGSKGFAVAQVQLERTSAATAFNPPPRPAPVAVPAPVASASPAAFAVVMGAGGRQYSVPAAGNAGYALVAGLDGVWRAQPLGLQYFAHYTNTTAAARSASETVTLDLSAIVPDGTTFVTLYADLLINTNGTTANAVIQANCGGRLVARAHTDVPESVSENAIAIQNAARVVPLPADKMLDVDLVLTATAGAFFDYGLGIDGYWVDYATIPT